jgi:hypothetical protein
VGVGTSAVGMTAGEIAGGMIGGLVPVPGGDGAERGGRSVWIIDNEGVINHRQFEPY